MDVGVWMSPAVLEAKLEHADTPKPEGAWNLARWPSGFDERGASPTRRRERWKVGRLFSHRFRGPLSS